MYVKQTGTLFQMVQISGNKVRIPNRCYVNKAQAQTYLTKNHNHAVKHKKHFVSDYAWLDLNNFEIVEYEVKEVARHKHPLTENQ